MVDSAGRPVATVFGGSGFIGRYVVPRLARAGYTVQVATRMPASARFLQTQGDVGQIVPLGADITQDRSVAAAVAGAALVVNLVGILAERRHGDFQRVHAEAAGRVARHAMAAGATRLVHLSAIGADPESPSAYGRSKAAGEQAVRAAFPAATILRPSIVFGPEDGFFNRFAGLSLRLPVMPVVSGATRLQPVFVGDVAAAVAAAALSPEATGRIYELGGPRVASFRDLLAYVLEATGQRKRLMTVPPAIAAAQAWFGEFLPNPPLTRDQLAMLERDNVVAEAALGLDDLGIRPTAMEAVVPAILARFAAARRARPVRSA